MKVRSLVVCMALVGCQVEAPDDVDVLDEDVVEDEPGNDVDIDAVGRLISVTICHRAHGSAPQTLDVPGLAAVVHLLLHRHDRLGACAATYCVPNSTIDCYDGPDGTEGVGTCTAGSQTCNATGTGYGACTGDVVPAGETCGDNLDNNCDGVADDSCVCAPGSAASCYTGPVGTEGVGTCTAGAQTCNATGTAYDACIGSIEPVAEQCGDGLDNDCDGTIDNGCCVPAPELCGDAIDNDCDGLIDETCVCVPASVQSCYSGPAGTEGVGLCHAGTRTCNAGGTAYGSCTGQVTPVGEVCGDGLDNDCDGQADEGCLGDRAWNDNNRNGIQDAGEVGLAGATFLLRTSSGALVSVTVSASTGAYWFQNVPAGSYYIEVIPPFNYRLSPSDVGGNDAVDNDFDSETGATNVFSFSGAATSTWDAGFYFLIQS